MAKTPKPIVNPGRATLDHWTKGSLYESRDIAFGSQIRSYVLQPYQMIKDHRTKVEVGDVHRVLGGDLDPFIKTYLMQKASGSLGTAAAADEGD